MEEQTNLCADERQEFGNEANPFYGQEFANFGADEYDFDIRDGEEEFSEETEEVEEEENLTPEEKLERLKKFMYAQPLNREIYYRVLNYCKERRPLTDIENYITTIPEFAAAIQSQFFIIDDLAREGALECFEYDAEGNVVTEADKEGLDENQIDDLVVSFAYEDTEIGAIAADLFSAKNRYLALVGGNEDNAFVCSSVLKFLAEKHNIVEIDKMLCSMKLPAKATLPVSVLIEKLEKAGVIAWNSGWVLTEEGRELIQED